MTPSWCRIERVRRETDDTFSVDLAPPDGAPGFAFSPGQFNMIYAFGAGEVPISISGDPGEVSRISHTTRAVGIVTRAMLRLRRGDMLGVRGPFGVGWPLEEAEGHDVVVVAGGIGLAPLRPAILRILAQRERYNRVVLLYGARTPDDLLYRQELKDWRGRLDIETAVTVDRSVGSWRGNVGVVTSLIGRGSFDPGNAVALICGPEVMIRFTVMGLQKQGVDLTRIFVSMERNMKCGIGWCGHCQFGPTFICKDGPVFRFDRIQPFFAVREL